MTQMKINEKYSGKEIHAVIVNKVDIDHTLMRLVFLLKGLAFLHILLLITPDSVYKITLPLNNKEGC